MPWYLLFMDTHAFWHPLPLTYCVLCIAFVELSALFSHFMRGWSGGAEVSCISRHRGVHLILAYSWARPAILVAGKGRGGNVFISSVSSLSLLFFIPCPSLSSLLLSLLSLFSLSLEDDTKWPTRVDVSLNPNTTNSHFMPSLILKNGRKGI